MARSWHCWSVMLLLSAVAGCGRVAPPPVAKQPAKATPSASPVVPQDSQRTEEPPDGGAGSMPQAEQLPDSEQDAADPSAIATVEPAADSALAADAAQVAEPSQPPKPERVAVFTPGGPLLIDVTMTIDGRPYNQAFDDLVAALMKAADSDDDGVSTWTELFANEEYLQGAAAGRPAMNARQKRDAVKEYDLNEDDKIQKGEATAWLGRNAGRSAAAFRVRGSRAYVPTARNHSRVWPFLDRDGNGELSTAELDSAADVLLRLDADDDQLLTLDEVASLREQLFAQNQMANANDATRDAAIHLEPGYTIERLDYLLPDLYSPRQTLSPESFSALPKLFEQLDESGEGWLDRDELARLLTIEPHVRLTIEFNSTPTAEHPAAMVTLNGVCEEVAQLGPATPSGVTLSLGGTRLTISAVGAAAAVQPMMPYGSEASSQLQMSVHDQNDALFEELDANGDGRLGAREMTDCRKRLAARDANQDGALTANELPYSMMITFMRGDVGGDGFYRPPTPAVAKTADAPEWFRSSDFNGDGDVSRREFLGEPVRFRMLDRNNDGFIDGDEALQAAAVANPAPSSPADEDSQSPSADGDAPAEVN